MTLTAETSAGADSSLSVQTQVIFSGPTVVRMDQPGNFSPSSDEWLTCLLYVGDANGHPLSAGTRVRVTAVGGSVSGQTDVLLPDTLDPDATRFTVQFRSAPGGGQARMTVSVTSPNGDLTQTFTGGLAPAGGQTGSQEPVSILLALKDTVLVADGKATTAVRASVLDSAGAGIPGVTVRFETSLGRLSSLSVPTDEDGVAETILVAGIEAGKASVVAASGQDLSTLASATFIRGTPTSIVLIDVTPASIGVRGAGGNETAIVTFEVRDQWGNTVADGESIFFRLDAPGQGDEKVGPDQAATVAGRAQAALSSGTVARTVRLVAEVAIAPGDTIRSTPVPIAIHGGPPDLTHFSLTAEPVNLAGRVLYGLESTITAFVFDKYSNPVPLGTSVRFRTNGGGVQGSSETNIDGQTSVTLFTAQPVPPEADSYLATVTGQTVDEAGQEIETSTTVLFSGPTAPIEITGGGADTISSGSLFIPEGRFQIVTFTVSDISGNPIMGGSTITVTSDVAVVSGHANVLVPDARSGNTSYGIVISDPVPFEDPPAPPARGSVLITVTSPNGNEQLTFGLTAD